MSLLKLNRLRIRGQPKIGLRRHNTQGVGVTSSTPPSLHADDGFALSEHTKLDGVHDAPLQAAVDVFLPRFRVEVGLLLGEEERVDTAVEVRVLQEWSEMKLTRLFNREGFQDYPRSATIARDHDDGANRTVFGDEAGGLASDRLSNYV